MGTKFGLFSYLAAATLGCAIGSCMKLLLGVAKLPRLRAMVIFFYFFQLTRHAAKMKLKLEQKKTKNQF